MAAGALTGGLLVLALPASTQAQSLVGGRSTPGATARLLTAGELAACVSAVHSLLGAQLSDMAVGVPDRNEALVEQTRSRLADDPSAWKHVADVASSMTSAATVDFLGRYDRDVRAVLDAYAPRIVLACNS